MEMTKKQTEAFEKAEQIFNSANKHSVMAEFRANAIENYNFYDGDQYSKYELDIYSKRGQKPITKNIIKPTIDYIVGMEVQSKMRTAYRSHSLYDKEAERLANAITNYGMSIQENESVDQITTKSFRDSLITGIGWMYIFREQNTQEAKLQYVNPLDVMFDANDMSLSFEKMSHVTRVRWVPEYDLVELYPQHKKYFKDLFSGDMDDGTETGELDHRVDGSIDLNALGQYGRGGRIPVVEVQYKEKKQCYQGIDSKGEMFQTFDFDKALELSNGTEEDLKKMYAPCVMRVVFCKDKLLEFSPIDPMKPNLHDFLYIPVVLGRKNLNGCPRGVVDELKDTQRQINIMGTKLLESLNSRDILVGQDAIPEGTDFEELRKNLTRLDNVTMVKDLSQINVQRHEPLIKGFNDAIDRFSADFQRLSGIYDESLGKETNATSGIAIRERQVNSVKNQIFYFDQVRYFKKRVAKMLLEFIQSSSSLSIETHVLNDDEKETIYLNVAKQTADGKNIMLNDIRTIPLKVYIEEIPDYASPYQEQRSIMEKILSMRDPMFVLQNESLLKVMGLRDAEKIANEFKIAQQGQQQMMPVDPQQSAGGM